MSSKARRRSGSGEATNAPQRGPQSRGTAEAGAGGAGADPGAAGGDDPHGPPSDLKPSDENFFPVTNQVPISTPEFKSIPFPYASDHRAALVELRVHRGGRFERIPAVRCTIHTSSGIIELVLEKGGEPVFMRDWDFAVVVEFDPAS